MTDLDKKLQQLATTDWHTFMTIVGQDNITVMKARILRQDGKSYQQICVQTGLTMAQARNAVKNVKSVKK
jgi:hypothetical protein